MARNQKIDCQLTPQVGGLPGEDQDGGADDADDGQRPAGAVARGRERGADLRDDDADHGVLQRDELAEQHQRDQDGDEPAG